MRYRYMFRTPTIGLLMLIMAMAIVVACGGAEETPADERRGNRCDRRAGVNGRPGAVSHQYAGSARRGADAHAEGIGDTGYGASHTGCVDTSG